MNDDQLKKLSSYQNKEILCIYLLYNISYITWHEATTLVSQVTDESGRSYNVKELFNSLNKSINENDK